MIPDYAKPFTYQIPWKSTSIHFGEHRGTQRGLGFEFKGNVSLVDYPDARRLDLRQTLRDPYEQLQVKVFNQDNTTPIFAVCDLSSSMQFKGVRRKLDIAKEIAASIAYSAFEMSDVFSFIAYNSNIIEELTISLNQYVHQAFEVIDQLSEYRQMGVGSEGLLEVSQYLSQQKGLVFWISDFHIPITLIEQTLNAMSVHHVIPIILWDDQEYMKLPKFGFSNLIDPETGRNETIFFRKAIKEQFIAAFGARKNALEALFSRFDSQPIFISGEFNPEIMETYFEEMMG